MLGVRMRLFVMVWNTTVEKAIAPCGNHHGQHLFAPARKDVVPVASGLDQHEHGDEGKCDDCQKYQLFFHDAYAFLLRSRKIKIALPKTPTVRPMEISYG